MTLHLPRSQVGRFREYLESKGFSFEKRPHQVFLARNEGIVINFYESGKIVFGGKNYSSMEEVRDFLLSIGGKDVKKKEYPPLDVSGTRIGTDEAGKGDYFGPLVIGGVLITEDKEAELSTLRIKDSKTLSEAAISNVATKIRQTVDKPEYETIWISPTKYNILYREFKNLNKILGWGHARVIETLLNNGKNCNVAIADQFGDQSYIEGALMKKGRKIKLIQVPHAERDLAVAAASILARDEFNRRFQQMNDSYRTTFPKGSSHVVEFGTQFVREHGTSALLDVAKVHFSITPQITGDVVLHIGGDVDTDGKIPRGFNEKSP